MGGVEPDRGSGAGAVEDPQGRWSSALSMPEPKGLELGGRYVLGDRLGKGGTAEVYRGWDDLLGVQRALKLLTVEHPRVRQSLRRRLRAEAQAMARIQHPNILRISDVGFHEEVDFVVMELADGGSLAEWIEERGPMAPVVAIGFMLQVLAGLAAAHAAGIVHRDVKPQNVLLDTRGTALLADFGIALVTHEDIGRTTRAGVAMGSLSFMAPEQRLDARSVDVTADIYSAAATLFNLLTGNNPVDLFTADEHSPRWGAIPTDLRAIIARGTLLDPAARFPDARSMATALLDLLDKASVAPLQGASLVDPVAFPNPRTSISISTRGGITDSPSVSDAVDAAPSPQDIAAARGSDAVADGPDSEAAPPGDDAAAGTAVPHQLDAPVSRPELAPGPSPEAVNAAVTFLGGAAEHYTRVHAELVAQAQAEAAAGARRIGRAGGTSAPTLASQVHELDELAQAPLGSVLPAFPASTPSPLFGQLRGSAGRRTRVAAAAGAALCVGAWWGIGAWRAASQEPGASSDLGVSAAVTTQPTAAPARSASGPADGSAASAPPTGSGSADEEEAVASPTPEPASTEVQAAAPSSAPAHVSTSQSAGSARRSSSTGSDARAGSLGSEDTTSEQPAPESAPAAAASTPLGTWRCNFNGRPATLTLSGTPTSLRGQVVVRFDGNEVSTPVTGSYDATTRVLVLQDLSDAADAGTYTLDLSASEDRFTGKFQAMGTGRMIQLTGRRL